MAKRKLKLFKDPKVIRCKNGDWYVGYYYRDPEHPGKWLEFKERCGLNRIKDETEKEVEFNLLRQDVLGWLMAGNSPFDTSRYDRQIDFKKQEVARIRAKQFGWSLRKAMAEYMIDALSQGHAKTTITAYKKYLKLFEEWLDDHQLLDSRASQFTEMDLTSFLNDQYKKKDDEGNLKWSPRTYNNYLKFMITFFAGARLLEKTATKNRHLKYDFNPEDLKTKTVIAKKNKAFTPVLRAKIKKACIDLGLYNLLDYLEWIFLSSMRPAEIRELRVNDVDTVNRQIKIIGKTGARIVPISEQLLSLIKKRNFESSDLNAYVFGYMGNVDERRMSVAYFLGQFDTIRETLKLTDDYGPYSMKPTGIIAMINAGFSDREIMGQTGHKTESAFNAYKRDLVIENESVMKGSTIEF